MSALQAGCGRWTCPRNSVKGGCRLREHERGPGANAKASEMLCGGVALFAPFPVAAALWGRDAPFTFSAGLFIGGAAGFAVFLLIRFRGLLRDREALFEALSRCRGARMALWVVGILT